MPALSRRMLDLDEEFNIYAEYDPYIGPSGSQGQSILKPGSQSPPHVLPRRVEALNLETSPSPISPVQVRKVVLSSPPVISPSLTFSSRPRPLSSSYSSVPKMDYYTHRSTYGLHDADDSYSGVSRSRASHLASHVLDDNDSISRRSRLNDARALGNMSHTMDALYAPSPRLVPRPVPITRPPPHSTLHTGVLRQPVRRVAIQSRVPIHHRPALVNTNYVYPIHTSSNVRYIQEEPMPYKRYERIEALDLHRAAESLNNIKRQVVDIQAGLGSQRILLDRYLPIELGPTPTVDQGVNKKYFELAVRMPNLEPEAYRKRTYLQDELTTRALTPRAMRSQSVPNNRSTKVKVQFLEPALIAYIANREAHSGQPRQVGSSSAPMSETRKNIRKLITRTRRDPGFYM